MTSHTSTFSRGLAASPSPRGGRDSAQSPSARSSRSARKSLRQGSGLLPTPSVADGMGGHISRGGDRKGELLLRGQIQCLSSSPTSETSTAPDSEGQLCLPGAFLANQRRSPGSEKERKMTVGSGRRLSEFWLKSNRSGPSLRTLLASLVSSEAWYSRTCYLRWKPRVMRSSRLLFQLAPSMPRTAGIESGLLHTPAEQELGVDAGRLQTKEGEPAKIGERAYDKKTGRLAQIGLPQQIVMMPLLKTPSTVETEGGVMEIRPGCDGHYKLRDQIAMLRTPRMNDYRGGVTGGKGSQRKPTDYFLPDQISMLPTPKGTPSGPDYARAGRDGSGGDDFQTFGERRGLKLQPAFVEWMQGYPIGWTHK